MHLSNLRLRLGMGLIAVLAIAVVVIAVGANRDAPSASAAGPTPTAIANDGSLGGVSDLLVGNLATNAGLFYCIAKTDHQTSNNALQVFLQCNIDVPGQGDTGLTPPPWSDTNPALRNPSETGADTIPGPPPPPPYTVLAPAKGYGTYYPAGGAPCPTASPCTIVTSCFEDVGSPLGIGPNIISTATINNPKTGVTVDMPPAGAGPEDVDQVSSGTVSIWYNQNNANCKAGTPAGAANFAGLPIQSIRAYGKAGATPNAKPAPWRRAAVSTLDFDGDGCTDAQELSQTAAPLPVKCGDDPQNPSDSFNPNTVNLSGIYDITTRVIRADTGSPGIYFYCRANIQHNTGTNAVTATPFCYTDSIASAINAEGFPGVMGDGYSGAPPPGLCSDGTCANGNFAFADIDPTPTSLTGTFSKVTNNITISGCFADQDGQSSLGNVYVTLTASAHQLPGTVDIWILQTASNCTGGTPVGAPTFDDAEVSFVRPNPSKGLNYDQDDDGVKTARELDNTTNCGHRDPYNQYDYFDVSIPRDGVIDLSNDILGVILHYAPGGYPAGDENWDRGQAIAGSAGNWNRRASDGVIDLSNDILGVILQYNPGGCP